MLWADILYSAGRYLEAAHHYGRIGADGSGILFSKPVLSMGGEAQKALELRECCA